MKFKELANLVRSLPTEKQDTLKELINGESIDRQQEIFASDTEVMPGSTADKETVSDPITDLPGEDDESVLA
jgi:hypothetical protein